MVESGVARHSPAGMVTIQQQQQQQQTQQQQTQQQQQLSNGGTQPSTIGLGLGLGIVTSGTLNNGQTGVITTTTGQRCGILETRVRGAWYRVMVILESDYLSVSLDESCDPVDHSTTLNGTLG